MTDEIQSAITSDKVETDNTNFATVKADQTCEEALVPRENAFQQLTWQVTMEKGSVYNPPETVGIYAEEVDCKYGVQVAGDIFGRQGVTFEYGGAAHGAADSDEPLGVRVFGSVLSEGQIEVTEPDAKLDDWAERPVQVYGDVKGSHITFDRPTVVYGCVHAEQTLRTNAPTVVVGDVYSGGMVEAVDLFAFSLISHDDLTLGSNVAVVNPVVRSETGSVRITDRVGLFVPKIFEQVSAGNDIDAPGLWLFDVDAVWENALVPADVISRGDGEVADRSWRTVNELGDDYYQDVRKLFRGSIQTTRRDPPEIEEFRYGGLGSVGGGDTTIEGDVVVGEQSKKVEDHDVTNIDQSTTKVDKSTEVHDESTTVEDSVVNRSDIGDNGREGGE